MQIIVEPSWACVLKNEFEKTYFKKLMEFVSDEYQKNETSIFPARENLFRAFEVCPYEQVKVVILGQDPYHTKGHAHGLCFSVEEDVKPFPKSLLNIFKEIETDLKQSIPPNGSLERWAKQGVLLLNSVLTVKEGQAGSHMNKGWEQFSDAVIQVLGKQKENVVYVLWGAKAQEKGGNIDSLKNCVLTSVHPSPLSSYRGFFGCKHFSKTNEYLISKEIAPIVW